MFDTLRWLGDDCWEARGSPVSISTFLKLKLILVTSLCEQYTAPSSIVYRKAAPAHLSLFISGITFYVTFFYNYFPVHDARGFDLLSLNKSRAIGYSKSGITAAWIASSRSSRESKVACEEQKYLFASSNATMRYGTSWLSLVLRPKLIGYCKERKNGIWRLSQCQVVVHNK